MRAEELENWRYAAFPAQSSDWSRFPCRENGSDGLFECLVHPVHKLLSSRKLLEKCWQNGVLTLKAAICSLTSHAAASR